MKEIKKSSKKKKPKIHYLYSEDSPEPIICIEDEENPDMCGAFFFDPTTSLWLD